MRNIGGNVGDARLREEDCGGWGGVLHMSLLIVCVCVFAFACLSVCLFDISVTYRAAVSL